MGLVMQEPTLFNYSIKENILYGKINATNEKIVEAATVANALEFIEDNQLSQAFDDDPATLLKAMESDEFSEQVKSKIEPEEFLKFIEDLKKLD